MTISLNRKMLLHLQQPVVCFMAVVCTLSLGWYTASTFAQLLRGPLPIATSTLAITYHPPEEMFDSEMDSSPWEFIAAEKSLQVRTVSATLVNEILDSPLSNFSNGEKIVDGLWSSFIKDGNRVLLTDCVRYDIDYPNFKQRLFTRNLQHEEHWLVCRVALAKSQSDWQVWEVTPKSNEHGSLLPLPNFCCVLASKKSPTGTLLGNLVQNNVGELELRMAWSANGWSVKGQNLRQGLFCSRSDCTIRAWSPAPPDRSEGVLFFTRIR